MPARHQHALAAFVTLSAFSVIHLVHAGGIVPVFQSRTVTADSIVSSPGQQDFESITAPDFDVFDAQANAKISNANALSQTSAAQLSTIESCALNGVGHAFSLAETAATGFHGYSVSNSSYYVIFDIDETVEFLVHGTLSGSEFGHASLTLQKHPAGAGVVFMRSASNQTLGVHHRAQLLPGRYILSYDAVSSASANEPANMVNTADFDLQFTLCFIPADINVDGAVNVSDLLDVINSWGACPSQPQPCAADVNLDSLVNVADLLSVINAWGS